MIIETQEVRDKTGFDYDIASDELLNSNSFIPLSEAEVQDVFSKKQLDYASLSEVGKTFYKEAILCLVSAKLCRRQATKIQDEMKTVKKKELEMQMQGSAFNYGRLEKAYMDEYVSYVGKAIATTTTDNGLNSVVMFRVVKGAY